MPGVIVRAKPRTTGCDDPVVCGAFQVVTAPVSGPVAATDGSTLPATGAPAHAGALLGLGLGLLVAGGLLLWPRRTGGAHRI